jgi:hypothetical protein
MPRKDQIHDAVKKALVKDGWIVINDPYTLTRPKCVPSRNFR